MPKTDNEQAKSSESTLLTSLLRNTVQQGSIYFISVVGIGLASLVVLPIYARIFTTTEYGLLSLAILLVSLGSIVIGNWLTSCTLRFLPYYQRIGKTDTFYSTILLSMIFSLAGFIILGIPAYFLLRGSLAGEFQSLIPLVAVLIPLTLLFEISLAILRIKQEAKMYIAGQLGFTYASLIIGVPLAVYLSLGVSGILWGQVISLLILGVIMFKRLFLTGSSVRLSAISLPSVKEFAFYGLPATTAVLGSWILSGSDRYIIDYFRGTAEVGLYSMGYAIGNIIMMLVTAFILAAVPTLMLTYESDNREITARLLSQLTRILILIVLPATVGLSVLASPIIRLLTTSPYYSAFVVIPFVALGNFTYGLCLLSHVGLLTAKKTPILARNWFAAGGLNVLLNIILVPKFGFIAAAVTTLASYIVLLILNMTSASKYLKWTVLPRPALNSILASLIMGAAIFLVIQISPSSTVDCVLGVITGIIAYLGMLLLLKEFSWGEILQIMRKVKGKLPWAKHS